jgi:hypothetical protein
VNDSIPPLDPEIVQALRGDEPAPPEVRSRARQRLLGAVAGAAVVHAPRGSLGRTAGWTAVAFALGTAVGAGLHAMLVHEPAPRVVYVDRLVPAPPVETETPAPAPAAPAPKASAAAPPPAAVPSVSTTRASQLSAERVLLDEARAALAQGEPDRALEKLERHRRTFPAPLLGEERDAMVVQALAKAGRADEAKTRAESFRRRYPDSLFSSVVDSAAPR